MIEITKSDLTAWHAAITKAGSYQANRCMDDMSIIFNWALEEKIIKEINGIKIFLFKQHMSFTRCLNMFNSACTFSM